ncbi:hypothetical protein DK45_4375 [Bordetella bronchiseptica]|nr:hypothetical protein DK45_4375 [Bordetella bronchiseptica]
MISNETFWPSFRVLKPFIWMDEKCANRSSPPSSGVMKPNPFASLNHLTVPVALGLSPWTAVAVVSDMRTASLNRMLSEGCGSVCFLPLPGVRIGLVTAESPPNAWIMRWFSFGRQVWKLRISGCKST